MSVVAKYFKFCFPRGDPIAIVIARCAYDKAVDAVLRFRVWRRLRWEGMRKECS